MLSGLRILWREADPRFKQIVHICWPIYAALPFVLATGPVVAISHWEPYTVVAGVLMILCVMLSWMRLRPVMQEMDEKWVRFSREQEEAERLHKEDLARQAKLAAERRQKAFEDELRASEASLR